MSIFRKLTTATLLTAATLAGCNKGSTAQQAAQKPEIHKAADPHAVKLAFVTNNASEYWKLAQAGVEKYAKETGIQTVFRMPKDLGEQNTILSELVSNGYSGIAISVIAPNDQVSNVNDACKKTNVICVDSDCPASVRLEYMGTENYTAGREMGKQIVKLMPDGGKIAVFVGNFAADNAAQRFKGIQDEIAGHKIDVAFKKEDHEDHAGARTNVEDVMNGNPDVKLMCGLWSYNGPAISDAIKAAHKEGKVLAVVFDTEKGTMDGIRDGYITVTVAQQPYAFGYDSCKQLFELATQGTDAKLPDGGKKLYTVTPYTKANIGEFDAKSGV